MQAIEQIVRRFAPISLSEMEDVKLMNRIDTKYVVPRSVLPAILEAAEADYFAQEIDGKRVATYNTLYYDTDTLDMYIRHHDRHLVRQKIRVREYVDSHLTFLEIKRKNNKGRTKKKRMAIEPLPGLPLKGEEIEAFVAAKSRYTWDELSPRLWTKFHRITLVNKQKTERLTIDLDLRWENVVTGQSCTYPELVIIELKRDGNTHSPMADILLDLRVHPLKISKYCIGTALTTPEVKQNRFKLKIRKIEKLCLS